METSILALGLRHGLDADHLAAIDGFARFRPNRWNGVLFAAGHRVVVTVLAASVRQFLGDADLNWLSPWLFLSIAIANLWRLLRPGHTFARQPGQSWIALGPLTMGILLAIGFETASQLSALSLAQHVSPLSLGAAFTLGMIVTDGMDGVLAARVQRSVGLRAKIAGLAVLRLRRLCAPGYGADGPSPRSAAFCGSRGLARVDPARTACLVRGGIT